MFRSYSIEGYFNINVEALQAWALSKSPKDVRYIILAELYNDLASLNNCNPVFLFAQFSVCTDYMYKNGPINGYDESLCNPCRLANSTGTSGFQFYTWEDGISAQIDHALLYAGASGYPKFTTLDTRHFKYLYKTRTDVESMLKSSVNEKHAKDVISVMDEIYTYLENYDDTRNSITNIPSISNLKDEEVILVKSSSLLGTLFKTLYNNGGVTKQNIDKIIDVLRK